ncbi:MAG: 4-(cytidine 5'-diphospho)-2-C-methyl-D-erythritol kinase [Chloroflexi bacterium]|nr:4-(cytidine 5'-diphospho)-2-C-methyl-D-erythritol kinase [Chloroflexota bacterium]
MLRHLAPAKLNLSLEVLGQRLDGYHEVRTVLQTVSLHDTMTVAPATELTIEGGPQLAIPEEHTIWRVANSLSQTCGVTLGARIRLTKRIPLAAGLGGGSSDAAVALLLLNKLWGCQLPLAQLSNLAAQIGADVPFFLRGGTALAFGKGEQVEPLPPFPSCWVVLLMNDLPMGTDKTRRLYASLQPSDFDDGSATMRLVQALRDNDVWPLPIGHNTFEQVLARRFPEASACRKLLTEAGAEGVGLTGSGPTFYGLWRDESTARRARRQLTKAGRRAILARTSNMI